MLHKVMGRIKTALTKRMTLLLLKKHKDRFTEDFNHNKKAVSELTTVSSQKLRNIIAGYASRIVRRGDQQSTYRPPIMPEGRDPTRPSRRGAFRKDRDHDR